MRTRSLRPAVLLGLVVVLVVGSALWLLFSLAGTSAAPGSDEANPVPFVARAAPRPSPEVPPDPPEPAPASVAVCSDSGPEIGEDPGNEAETWIYLVTVTNSTDEACALGGIPQVSVQAETGDVLPVTVSGVPVPPVPEEVQPPRFLVPPGGSASVGIQWGSPVSRRRSGSSSRPKAPWSGHRWSGGPAAFPEATN